MAEVLIVDDDPVSRRHLRLLLSSGPYRRWSVVECESADQGLRAIRSEQPLVMFFDPALPDNQGMRFQRQALLLEPKLWAVVTSQLKMFEMVYDAINDGCRGYLVKPVMRSELYRLLERLTAQRSEKTKVARSTLPAPSGEIELGDPVKSAIHYVQHHFAEPLSVPEVAALVYLSPSYFSRLFKQETGVTFVEYLTAVRLNHAKQLLRMTQLPIEAVARSTGFGNQSYFTALFRREEGWTPREYRRRFSVREGGDPWERAEKLKPKSEDPDKFPGRSALR